MSILLTQAGYKYEVCNVVHTFDGIDCLMNHFDEWIETSVPGNMILSIYNK